MWNAEPKDSNSGVMSGKSRRIIENCQYHGHDPHNKKRYNHPIFFCFLFFAIVPSRYSPPVPQASIVKNQWSKIAKYVKPRRVAVPALMIQSVTQFTHLACARDEWNREFNLRLFEVEGRISTSFFST